MRLIQFLQEKEELLMLTHGSYKPENYPGNVCVRKGLIIHIDVDAHRMKDGHCAYLVLDGRIWMTTHRGEHLDMQNAIDRCPKDARVFVAGLGLGLILLYLARSGKAREVVVIEIDRRVIEAVEQRIRPWLSKHYPEFKWRLIEGDAEKQAQKHGVFDWFFWDIWATPEFSEGASERHRDLSRPFLSDRGVVTTWHDLVKLREERS